MIQSVHARTVGRSITRSTTNKQPARSTQIYLRLEILFQESYLRALGQVCKIETGKMMQNIEFQYFQRDNFRISNEIQNRNFKRRLSMKTEVM